MIDLTPLDRALINRFQGGFPVVRRPYSWVAAKLDTEESTLISSIRRLLDAGWLSRCGPLYDAERLGGGLLLAALEVPEGEFARVSALVNAMPEVAHNYRRDHRLNMWFVLATERGEELEAALDRIRRRTGLPVFAFPKLQEFYLGLWLQIAADGSVSTVSVAVPQHRPGQRLDNLDRRIVAATQAGLALTSEPFAQIATRLGCGPDAVLGRLQAMLSSGVIRRIGVVPNHYRMGLRGNGMSVWDIADERLEAAGRRVGSLDYVSHCYARPRHLPDWPYNLFAMVHGDSRAEVERQVERIADCLGDDDRGHEVLFSSALLKKTGLRLSGQPGL